MKFKYALFDFDMTLIDSIGPLLVSSNLLAKEFGLPEVSYEEVLKAEISTPNCTFELLWKGLWGHYQEQWYQAYKDHLTEPEYQAMRLYPSGLETLLALKKKNISLGVASNRDYPRKALVALEIENLFQVVLGQFDVKNTKPDPEILLKAIELFGARADEVLYICDSTGDLMCAKAAKVKSFAMTTGGHSAEKLLELGAYKTGDKLSEILICF